MTQDAFPVLAPMLAVSDARAAIAFYEAVFGARRRPPTLTGPDGAIAHAEVEIAGAVVMLADESFAGATPQTLGGTGVRLNLMVDDPDAVAARAVAHGAEIVFPIADQFYGHRSGRLRDPFGHEWILSAVNEPLSEAEMQARFDRLTAGSD